VIDKVRGWFDHPLATFVAGQAIALIAVLISIVAYSARLDARVSTLEIRGSPHLEKIDSRLTVLEAQTTANAERLDRIVDVMTKKLNINP